VNPIPAIVQAVIAGKDACQKIIDRLSRHGIPPKNQGIPSESKIKPFIPFRFSTLWPPHAYSLSARHFLRFPGSKTLLPDSALLAHTLNHSIPMEMALGIAPDIVF
jgi:hypothetical protein